MERPECVVFNLLHSYIRIGGLASVGNALHFQVLCPCLQVLDSSPARTAGLEAYFDFIISIDGVRLVSGS